MNARRRLLSHLGGLSAVGIAGAISSGLGADVLRRARASDYKALVCVHLNGGNDGNDSLVPTDAAYNDYAAVRGSLALPKTSLAALPGRSAGHSFGMHPGLAPIAPLYAQGRLAWVANVGPLVRPTTAAQVLDRVAEVPPFLLSHSDQVAMIQGWTGDEDPSGWGGRALETLPDGLRSPMSPVAFSSLQTLVMGKRSRVVRTDPGGQRYWGWSDLGNSGNDWTRAIESLTRLQSVNAYEAEYARSLGANFRESTLISNLLQAAPEPVGAFAADQIGDQMRFLAKLLPSFKASGERRQIFLIDWGSFDTHVGQRGTGPNAQDSQLAQLGNALAAFDASVRAAGMADEVITMILTDFGRTLKPSSGGGTEHSWGNHLFLFGNPVRGGQVHGTFPSLTLGGPDDFDFNRDGRWVPTTSSDQLGATLASWLGMPSDRITDVFPNLANFATRTLPLLG